MSVDSTAAGEAKGYAGQDLNWHPKTAWIRNTLLECLESNGGGGIPELQFVKEEETLVVRDVSDGNLNHVLRVSSSVDPSRTVIFKHAPPYIKVLGPDYPLAEDRGELEYKALVRFNEACPGCVPKPIAYHAKNRALCMEDLKEYEMYRKWLLAGNTDEGLARKLARSLAIVHRNTHVATLSKEAFSQLLEEFRNPHLVQITDTYIFTNPFTPKEATNHWSPLLDPYVRAVQGDPQLVDADHHMQQVFHEQKEALIHGDLHTGSAMVKEDDIKIFDAEFAIVGPCAMDVGLLLANYIFCYYHHLLHSPPSERHRKVADQLKNVCIATVEEYLQHMTCSVGDRKQYTDQLMSDTAGFTGCELVRRLLSAGRVEDMDSMECAQPEALAAGCRLLRFRHTVHDAATLMKVALNHQ